MVITISALAFVIATVIGHVRGQQQIDQTDDVSMVFALFREGHRNPSNVEQFINSPSFGGQYRPDEPWRRGPGRLNKLGKQQAFSFGQFLRRRYAKFFNSAIEDVLDFEIAKAFSAPSACNQATMQLVLAGLFPAAENDFTWNTVNSTGFWQPYLYTVNDRLTAATNASCPELKRLYDTVKDDATPSALEWLADDLRLNSIFTERTGLNASLKHLADFGEFIQVLLSFNSTLPPWLLEAEKPTTTVTPTTTTPLPLLADFVQALNGSGSSTNAPNASTTTGGAGGTPVPELPEAWATKFLRFRNAHAQLCANDSDCRRLAGGYFLNHLLETMMLKREDKIPKRRLHLYSARPETLAAIESLLQTRGFDDGNRPAPLSPLSGLLIEYRDTPQPSIRILTHEIGSSVEAGGESITHTRVLTSLMDTTYCPKQDWCRLDNTIKAVGLDTFDDWDKLCKTGEVSVALACASSSNNNGTPTNIALVRDALSEQESSAGGGVPSENGKKLKSTECAFEWDKSGTRPCRNWAAHGYCNLYDSVRWLFCRRTCLCNPEFL